MVTLRAVEAKLKVARCENRRLRAALAADRAAALRLSDLYYLQGAAALRLSNIDYLRGFEVAEVFGFVYDEKSRTFSAPTRAIGAFSR